MPKLSAMQKSFLEEATKKYKSALPGSPAEEYLESRGLTNPAIADEVGKFCLGYVADPLPGHEMFRGCWPSPTSGRLQAADGRSSRCGFGASRKGAITRITASTCRLRVTRLGCTTRWRHQERRPNRDLRRRD